MPAKLNRDSFFWTIALQTVVVNFFLGGFGPAQPLLRADQGTSLTIAGLHGTAMGVASILAGLSNPWFSHKFGRANAGWIGLTIFVGGLISLSFLQPVPLTILAAAITGFGTSTVINSFVTSLNSHYGALAPLAAPDAERRRTPAQAGGTGGPRQPAHATKPRGGPGAGRPCTGARRVAPRVLLRLTA